MSMATKSSTSTNRPTRNQHQQPFRCFNIPISILVTLTAGTQIGDTIPSVQMENVWLTGQLRATLFFCTILRMSLASSRVVGTLVWHTNPDLAFVSVGHESWSLDRGILEKFFRSQHRPSLITATKLVTSVPSAPYRRWNFRKANWELYSPITDNKLAKNLPSPDSRLGFLLLQAAKRSIPRGCRTLQKQQQTMLECGV